MRCVFVVFEFGARLRNRALKNGYFKIRFNRVVDKRLNIKLMNS